MYLGTFVHRYVVRRYDWILLGGQAKPMQIMSTKPGMFRELKKYKKLTEACMILMSTLMTNEVDD